MEPRITILSENTGIMGNFLAEWGLSILLETDEANVLFDTGRTMSATHNADTLGINLNKVNKIVLSHSHIDHTGGLREVLRRIGKSEIEIIAHPHVWALRYNHRPGRADRFTGIPFQRQELENYGATFKLTANIVKISDNIITSGEIPMITDFETVNSGNSTLFIKEDGRMKPDEILDDQAIVVKTEQGLVVVTGCAHRGIVNTLYHAQHITGVKNIFAVIGGAHLMDASEERIRMTIAALKELKIKKLALCHCTGMPAITRIAHQFRDSFLYSNAGTIIKLP